MGKGRLPFYAELSILVVLDMEAESLALQLVGALYNSTDGLPQQWRSLEELEAATNNAAIYAFTRGWIIIEGGHSICLTDAGRRQVRESIRSRV